MPNRAVVQNDMDEGETVYRSGEGLDIFPPAQVVAERPRRGRFQVTVGEYLSETTPEERQGIVESSQRMIIRLLDEGTSVYLERFGILHSLVTKAIRSRVQGDHSLVYTEELATVGFEKCAELLPLHEERFSGIVSTRELAALILYEEGSRARWTHDELYRHLRGALLLLRDEVVRDGISAMFERIGSFISLHNRQGHSPGDWFAGADIFIDPLYRRVVSYGDERLLERPELFTALEPFEALYGKPLSMVTIDLPKELLTVDGYAGRDEAEIREEVVREFGGSEIHVGAFFVPGGEGVPDGVLFCTEGLRDLAHRQGTGIGTEILFYMSSEGLPATPSRLRRSELRRLCSRALTLGWLLMTANPRRTLREGMGVSCEGPLFHGFDSSLTTIIATKFDGIPSEQISPSGPFRYMTVVGLTDEEASAAARYSPRFLIKLLKHRELHQMTRISRLAVTNKTIFQFEVA